MSTIENKNKKILTEKQKQFPYSFPVFCPVSVSRLNFVSASDIPAIIEKKETIYGSYVLIQEDYLSFSIPTTAKNPAKSLIQKVAEIIIFMDSLWHYTTTETSLLPESLNQYSVSAIIMSSLFVLEELLAPNRIPNDADDISIVEGKHILFNATQKVFNLLKSIHLYPIILDKELSDYVKTWEHKRITLPDKSIEERMIIQKHPLYRLGRLITEKQQRFILTYSLFYLKSLINAFSTATEIANYLAVHLTSIFPYKVMKDPTFVAKIHQLAIDQNKLYREK